jgi:uncharacterized membrane protein YheB (UPF0754 family)
MNISKTTTTNTVASLITITALNTPEPIHTPLLYTGLFALSGALTNHLAIHMLFEKVPFLYGSGIIELKFESFKKSIKEMIITQFFTKEQLNNFFEKEEKKIDLKPLVESTDFSPAYDALKKTVMESKFGNMIGMIGGESALEGLREPFANKIKSAVSKIVSSQTFQEQLTQQLKNSTLSDDLLNSIEKIVENRLNELSPQLVKEMMQDLMKEHLGWLVVWGGVFGGLIGLISSFLL